MQFLLTYCLVTCAVGFRFAQRCWVCESGRAVNSKSKGLFNCRWVQQHASTADILHCTLYIEGLLCFK